MRFCLFLQKMHINAVDLSKQNDLDAHSRAIQQILFTGKLSTNVLIYYILEKLKETIKSCCQE